MKMNDPLKIVNAGLTVVQILEASIRLQSLAAAAVLAGKKTVTEEEMKAAVSDNDAALDALRAAIERADDR